MKPEIKLFNTIKIRTEANIHTPEEVTVYGRGAGLYSYLNVLAEKIAVPRFDRQQFEIKQ